MSEPPFARAGSFVRPHEGPVSRALLARALPTIPRSPSLRAELERVSSWRGSATSYLPTGSPPRGSSPGATAFLDPTFELRWSGWRPSAHRRFRGALCRPSTRRAFLRVIGSTQAKHTFGRDLQDSPPRSGGARRRARAAVLRVDVLDLSPGGADDHWKLIHPCKACVPPRCRSVTGRACATATHALVADDRCMSERYRRLGGGARACSRLPGALGTRRPRS